MRLHGAEIQKVEDFKYLGSTVQSNGEFEEEVYASRLEWVEKMLGVMCDKRV